MKTSNLLSNSLATLIAICAAPFASHAATSYTITTTTADAFLAAGSPNNPVGTDLTSLNFGGAGTLAISAASSTKGEFDSIIKFNTAAAVSQFNTTYGAGNWQITGVTLSLASNFGVQGSQPGNAIFNIINAGLFGIDWLGYDNWTEGTGGGMGSSGFPNNSSVSFNSISTLFAGGSASLGTFNYTPPGNNIYLNYVLPLNANLVSDTAAGGDVSLYFYAADNNVGYLFNARSFGSNTPELTLTASAVPEPSISALMLAAVGALPFAQRARMKVRS